MNQKTEKDIALYYLNNLLKRPMYGELEDKLCRWFEENSCELIGKDLEDIWESRRRGRRWAHEDDEQLMPRDCKTIRMLLNGKTGRLPDMPEVSAIAKAFHLSPEYRDVLTLRICVTTIPMLDNLVDSFRNTSAKRMMSSLMGIPQKRYEKFFLPTSELLEKGLFQKSDRDSNAHYPTKTLDTVLYAQCRTPEAVKRVVLGKPQKATLKPEHFEHLREEYVWIKNLIANALEKRQRGVNILIYGKPGTGKTEMAKTLCKEIGIPLYAVSSDTSNERNDFGRRGDLAAALCLLQDDYRSVLLMDEAEDVFGASRRYFMFFDDEESYSRGSDSKSKLFFNKLLERNAVPVIWISNSIRGVDPAHLRRFSYALNMEAPDETVQARIWNYSARKNKVKLPKKTIDKLVKSYDIAPVIIDTSLRTAALTGDHDAIEKTIDSLQTAMHGRSGKREHIAEHEFSTALLNCDLDLEKLAQRITSLKSTAFSLCLYGVPGSGKSAYARYLAEQLKMKVLHKRASDLLSMWVGGSEKNIAAAFAEARRKKMLLVIDEADSFLQDRRHAHRSWEVTQVNEMLTQMESHPLPFVCTTNLMDDLDQASLRRFTFKVKYDFLTRNQIETAFTHFFGAEPPNSLGSLTCLAPGDFTVVAKKARICGIDNPNELVAMLRVEQDVKEVRKSVGFAT